MSQRYFTPLTQVPYRGTWYKPRDIFLADPDDSDIKTWVRNHAIKEVEAPEEITSEPETAPRHDMDPLDISDSPTNRDVVATTEEPLKRDKKGRYKRRDVRPTK